MLYDIEKEKHKIIEGLISRGYTNKFISYAEFLKLYQPHKSEMKEKDFALILGISYRNYFSMKNKKTRAKILKTREITEERRQEIQANLRSKEYSDKSISYTEFLELYETYKQEMKETDFALILGISYANYNNMKNKGRKIKILRIEEIAE